ncbi:class I SAM-dependent methyltransferase [Xanthomonas massiliensis]|uniref:class I SAM-dependent methyltransferase n=1 Tax=Xanthomonas massiliensis TaxID=1720302 RepID=UPI0008267AE0|nr:methyltransferase domain-containing protein [Xanthomonas massiliensis]
MPGYSVRHEQVTVGGHLYRLRVLSDRQQFSDPDGHGARLGISSAQWSLFGQLWPAERLLAQAMTQFDVQGKRILELGCGIGLASLVLQHREADVVASDVHPLAEPFLAYNAALNALPAVHYRQLRWDMPLPTLGQFDVIIASDVLYEIDHALLLAGVVERHALPTAEVVLTDPGRGNSTRFSRLMADQGFHALEERCPMNDKDLPPFRGRLLRYARGASA